MTSSRPAIAGSETESVDTDGVSTDDTLVAQAGCAAVIPGAPLRAAGSGTSAR